MTGTVGRVKEDSGEEGLGAGDEEMPAGTSSAAWRSGGASSGGSGGPHSCRILLSVSTQQSAGVDVSALARMVCV